MVVAHKCKCKRAACKLASEKQAPKLGKLRDSLVPGTVVIILAGRFAGNRAVFLKRLDSGLLLLSGPYKYNGVPLRRIAAAYVIATSTKVDISDVDVSAVNDSLFKRPREAKQRKDAKRFFGRRVGVCIFFPTTEFSCASTETGKKRRDVERNKGYETANRTGCGSVFLLFVVNIETPSSPFDVARFS